MGKLVHCAAAVALAIGSGAVLAQASKYPSRTVRMIVGFSPGGATDIIARYLGPPLTESLGQSMVVENRPGASSQIAGDLVAKSPPDGHVLMMTTQTLMTSAMIERKTYPDIMKDYSHVALTATSDLILAVNPSLPVRSVKELIALARARPGELNYASGGIGTTLHLGGELLKTMAKVNIVHVPYKGPGAAVIAVLSGEAAFYFGSGPTVAPHVNTGKLRALATTGVKRSKGFPHLPTVSETVPGHESTQWFGFLAPAGTPRDIIARVHAAIVAAVAKPKVTEQLAAVGSEPVANSPAEFAAFITAEIAKWGRVVKSGVPLE